MKGYIKWIENTSVKQWQILGGWYAFCSVMQYLTVPDQGVLHAMAISFLMVWLGVTGAYLIETYA